MSIEEKCTTDTDPIPISISIKSTFTKESILTHIYPYDYYKGVLWADEPEEQKHQCPKEWERVKKRKRKFYKKTNKK